MSEIIVKIKGIEVKASTSGSGAPWIRATELAKVARKLLKNAGIKASVRTDRCIKITLPKVATDEQIKQAKDLCECLAGESFDGMRDLRETIDRKTDDGQKVYFGSYFVFVQRDWRDA